jgi:mono/diheme cytochrome c family protein
MAQITAPKSSNKALKLTAMVVATLAVVVVVILGLNMFISTPETPAPANLSPEAQQGKTLYLSTGNCNACHASEGRKGTLTGPRLSTTTQSEASIRIIIRQGKTTMPGNTNLSDADITKIVAYLQAIKAAAGS